jgi:hypothetical protein
VELLSLEKAGDPVIAAGIALIGVLIAAIISATISRRTAYLTTVTAERSKWIDNLRSNIAELAALCVYIHFKVNMTSLTEYGKSPEHDENLRKIENLKATIQLQLNPNGTIDQNILRILSRIHFLATRQEYTVVSAHWLLIAHSQWLLKEEWETVKYEASGLLRRRFAAVKRCYRVWAYKRFCREDGSLKDIVEDDGEG